MHLALVRDVKKLTLFLHGYPASGGEDAALLPLEIDQPLLIGDPNFVGTIDAVRISKGMRYTKETKLAATWETDADTLALYRFDEGRGEVLNDSSGNGHHSKIIGATWVKAAAK